MFVNLPFYVRRMNDYIGGGERVLVVGIVGMRAMNRQRRVCMIGENRKRIDRFSRRDQRIATRLPVTRRVGDDLREAVHRGMNRVIRM